MTKREWLARIGLWKGLSGWLLASSLAAAAWGQDTGGLEGTVTTLEGQPAAGAVVRIIDLRRETEADADGAFRWEGLRPGDYLVEARTAGRGHGIARAAVRAGEVSRIEIRITPEVHTDEIVVSASPILRSRLELAQPTNVLDGEDLLAAVQPSLGETLEQEAGIGSTYFGPGASRPIIRGLGGDRVRTLEGGIGTLDVSAVSPDHAVSLEPLQAERIEVLRGPATLLYGSSAVGGAVNVFDGRIPDYRASKPVSGTVDLVGSSVADERTGSLKLDGGGGDWAWRLGALVRDTDDYEIPGAAEVEGLDEHAEEEEEGDEHAEEGDFGILSNSDIRSEQGHVGATRFFGDKGFLGVSVSGFETEYGVPGGGEHGEHDEEGEEHEEEGEEEGDGIRIDMRQRRVDLNSELTQPFGAFRGLRTRVGLVDYEHDELEPSGEVGTTFFNDAWEARVDLVQKDRGPLSGSLGLQVGISELEAVGAEAFIPPTDTETLALFAFEEVTKGRVSVQFGGRFETQDTTTTAPDLPDRDFDGLSASLGIVGRPTDAWALGGSLSRAVKMPSGEELYAFGPHFATQVFEIGDPDLDEEVSVGVDLFVRRTAGRLTAELHVFRNDFSDYTFQTFTGEEEDGLPVTLFSQADAEFTGAELTATLELWERGDRHLDVDFLGDVVRAELDDGGDLPRIPPGRLGLGLSYQSSHWLARAEVRDVDDQDRVADNELPTEGYTLVNAHVGYRFVLGNQLLDVMLRGRNLGDETARNHVSFLKDRVPLPGRDIGLAIRYSF